MEPFNSPEGESSLHKGRLTLLNDRMGCFRPIAHMALRVYPQVVVMVAGEAASLRRTSDWIQRSNDYKQLRHPAVLN